MSITDAQLVALHPVCPGAVVKQECGREYVYLPSLKVMFGKVEKVVDGLLCPSEKDNYKTRLYLSEQIAVPLNWAPPTTILARTWYTWSWQNVGADLPLIQMLLEHLRAFR